jgi:hypothetical protein
LPLIAVGPVLVTPAPANTAKLPAVPRPTGACAAAAGSATTTTVAPRMAVAKEAQRIGRLTEMRMTCSVGSSVTPDESHPH